MNPRVNPSKNSPDIWSWNSITISPLSFKYAYFRGVSGALVIRDNPSEKAVTSYSIDIGIILPSMRKNYIVSATKLTESGDKLAKKKNLPYERISVII